MIRIAHWSRFARWVALLAVGGFLLVLAWLLPQPGLGLSRILLVAGLAGAAIGGAFGVVRGRIDLAVGGAIVLALLGFWQAVLSVFVWPVVLALLIAAIANRQPAVNESP